MKENGIGSMEMSTIIRWGEEEEKEAVGKRKRREGKKEEQNGGEGRERGR